MDATIDLTVNGKSHRITTDADRPLLEVLREDLHLSGPHYGCGEGECGACGVLIDGKRVFSCITSVSEAHGQPITSVEGLADGDKLHPVQQAFLDEGSFQCGYCTPGMIIAGAALLKEKPAPTDAEIVEAMNGNLCRCCGYTKIHAAIRRCASANGSTASGGVR